MITPEQLAELERMEREATPGKWHVTHHEGIGYRVWAEHPNPTPSYATATIADGQWNEVDGALIAAMRNDLPSLLVAARRVEELEAKLTTANARIAELEGVLRRIYDMGEPMSAAIAQGVVAPVTVELSAHAAAKVPR